MAMGIRDPLDPFGRPFHPYTPIMVNALQTLVPIKGPTTTSGTVTMQYEAPRPFVEIPIPDFQIGDTVNVVTKFYNGKDGITYVSPEGLQGVITGVELVQGAYRYHVLVNSTTSEYNPSELTLSGHAKQITYEVRESIYRSK